MLRTTFAFLCAAPECRQEDQVTSWIDAVTPSDKTLAHLKELLAALQPLLLRWGPPPDKVPTYTAFIRLWFGPLPVVEALVAVKAPTQNRVGAATLLMVTAPFLKAGMVLKEG